MLIINRLLKTTHDGAKCLYSWVPNKRPGTRIYFPKNASLYGPYLALYVYFKKKILKNFFFFFFFTLKYISLYILATQFLRNTTNSPDFVVNKTWYLYNLSLGRLLEGDPLKCCLLIQAAGTGSDCASSNFAYNLWDLPPYTLIWHYTIIKFVRFATLYSYLALSRTEMRPVPKCSVTCCKTGILT